MKNQEKVLGSPNVVGNGNLMWRPIGNFSTLQE
jgi:hypothetical protein